MLQFYFLSVLMNALAGYMFVFIRENEILDPAVAVSGNQSFFNTKEFRLFVGILSFITGFFKLLSPIRGDIAVIGDLLPAVGGLLGGFCLLFDYYISSTTVPVQMNEKIEMLITDGRKYIGISILASAILHFLFPTVLFL